jgi:hypothetical protein
VGWVRKVLGWTAEIVRHPKKLAPEQVMNAWVREFNKEGVPIDLEKLMAEKGPRPFLPKRWIVERTLALVGTEQEAEQGLREAAGEWRSFHLRGDESSDGEEISTLMRLFGQFQKQSSKKFSFGMRSASG